jgi:hypothetical protein
LCNFHGDAVVADHRAHRAESIVEHVGVQVEEVINLQEEAHDAVSESTEDAENAMDLVGAADPGADPGESASDQASVHRREFARESKPISRAPGAASVVDMRQIPLPLHGAPDPVSLGSSTSSRSTAGSSADSSSLLAPASTAEVLDLPVQPAVTRPRTRLQDHIVKPKVFTDDTVRYDHLGLAMIREPKTLLEALHDEHWKGAMDEEFSALMKNKTGHLVLAHQAQSIVDCKWVYKVK